MRARRIPVLIAAMVAACVFAAPRARVQLAAQDAAALSGAVTSAQEGAMEGVMVTARRAGSTIATTVVSDARGRYRFPRARLEPGQYALRIRATGYELDGPGAVTITAGQTATADLTLRTAGDVAAQLSNTEWLMSIPGTDAQKASIRGCAHCHTLERVMRSRHDADAWEAVIERMGTYPPLAFPLYPQREPAERVGGGPPNPEQQRVSRRRQAEYLATANLSASPQWTYSFKTLPRPKGRATQVIYTEYDLPARTRQPHDVVVDSHGMAWYAGFGEQILGKLDPKSGKITEYKVPVVKPGAPTGSLALRLDRDQNLWLGMLYQAAVGKFDRKTETFQTWSLPPELNGPHVQINQISPENSHVDGKVWFQDAGTYRVFRVDTKTGKFEVFEPYAIPRPNIYDVVSDPQNNVYFLAIGREDVGRIDAKTGDIRIFKTPTPGSGPRRGMIDSQARIWFGENRADKIGMFDTKTQAFQEWAPPTPGAWPYDVTIDRNGDVWAGGEYNDRILRLDPKSGQYVEYGLPRATNVRRVVVDNSAKPVAFWVGATHSATIIKLEPLE